ncbi:MAG: MFS transporter [Phycisphaerae bacterium]
MDLLGVRTLPFLTRRNYYYEFKHIMPWSMLAGLVEGMFASVVVAKTFHGSPLLIAIATTTPVAAYMFSLIWGMLCIGRPKIRLFMLFAAGTSLCTGVVGAIPTSPAGAIWFLCQMAAAQILLAGVVTVRSAVWKSNYPHTARARITARLQAVRLVTSNGTVLVAAGICDIDPTSYRYLFPCVALFGLLSVLVLSRIHIRGERSELRTHRGPRSDGDLRAGLAEPFSLTALLSPGHVFRQMVRVLRDDRRFTQYCFAQMLTGVANLMTIAVVVAIVTQDLQLGDAWGFWIATGLIQATQRLVMLASIGRWARLFDRIGVVRFRVVNVACWNLCMGFGLAATLVAEASEGLGATFLPLAVALFAVRAILQGLGLGGGALAHTLGHLHFARPEEAEIYMGIHVSLIGLRGLIAPLAGMWLYQTIGWSVWLIAIALSLGSLWMYAWMARYERREGIPPHPYDAIDD